MSLDQAAGKAPPKSDAELAAPIEAASDAELIGLVVVLPPKILPIALDPDLIALMMLSIGVVPEAFGVNNPAPIEPRLAIADKGDPWKVDVDVLGMVYPRNKPASSLNACSGNNWAF